VTPSRAFRKSAKTFEQLFVSLLKSFEQVL